MEKTNLTHTEWVQLYNIFTQEAVRVRQALAQIDKTISAIEETGFAASEHFIFALFGNSRDELASAQDVLARWIATIDANLESTMRGGRNESRSE